jgi:hypothetical protein
VTAPATRFRAYAYPPAGRIAVSILLALSAASLPAILLVVMLANDPPVTPSDVMRMVRDLTLLPGALGLLIRQAFRADVSVENELVIERRGVRLEVPFAAIGRVLPWRIPLPGPGCTLQLRSGRRLRDGGLELRDPAALVAALAARDVPAARAVVADAALAWASARAARPPRGWLHWIAKFPLFALLPTAVLFNAHQHIAHGALLGEYYSLGLGSYVRTFLTYHATLTIYLVLYASVWRGAAEAVTLAAAHLSPVSAPAVRRAAERVCSLAYYAGVPLLLLLRFVPW